MKIKKAILAMVCAVSMMASMIPVSAEEMAIGRANHVHVWGDKHLYRSDDSLGDTLAADLSVCFLDSEKP